MQTSSSVNEKKANPQLKAVGEFEILGKIDQGGIAEIYLGRQNSLDRLVAVKILSPTYSLDQDVIDRFESEARTIARLKHPNIVHIIDRGYENDRYYFVMDLIEGTTFKKMISDKLISTTRKLGVILQVLKALDYAHKNGVIHRDIKPANILIDKTGNAQVVDFGIAQILNKKDYEKTQPGVVMGSLPYMSPEQKVSSADIDFTTDIYSIGIILYEVFTGKRPVGRFKNPSSYNSDVSAELDRIIIKCLENNPRRRYQTASRLRDELLSVLHSKTKNSNKYDELDTDIKSFVGRLTHLDTLKISKTTASHLVEDQANHRLYVMKTIKDSDAGLKECRLLKPLDYPGFIKLHAFAGKKNNVVILMEYLRGGSLEDRIVKKYPPRVALSLFVQILKILDHAHKNNIIHGNLRPSNVLFDENDNIVITDFGQSQNHCKEKNDRYLSPERRKIRQSDIYSAGVILHILLSGQKPIFDSYLRLLWQESYPKIPNKLKILMLNMLRNDVKTRPHSIAEVISVIEKIDEELVDEYEKNSQPVKEVESKRRFRPGVMLVLLLIVLCGVLLISFGQSGID